MNEVDPYARPSVYDVLHGPGTRAEIDVLVDLADRFDAPGGARRRFLEPACGSGRYLRDLARRGHRVTGYDTDQGMLDYARARARGAGLERGITMLRADMADADVAIPASAFDVAFNPVNSIRHLMRARDLHAHFAQIARALRPGGLYVVGISLSAYGEEDVSEDEWIGRRGRCTVRQVVQYLPPERTTRRETVISHIEVERPRGIEVLDSTYALRSYDERQWKSALRDSAFERAGGVDDHGRDLPAIPLAYQLEVLRRI